MLFHESKSTMKILLTVRASEVLSKPGQQKYHFKNLLEVQKPKKSVTRDPYDVIRRKICTHRSIISFHNS